eukprot:EG_transcript_44597
MAVRVVKRMGEINGLSSLTRSKHVPNGGAHTPMDPLPGAHWVCACAEGGTPSRLLCAGQRRGGQNPKSGRPGGPFGPGGGMEDRGESSSRRSDSRSSRSRK